MTYPIEQISLLISKHYKDTNQQDLFIKSFEFINKYSQIYSKISKQPSVEDKSNIFDRPKFKSQKNIQSINVKNYGARGNGLVDDTKAFQKAINFANSSGIKLVIVPKGNYIVTGTIIIIDL